MHLLACLLLLPFLAYSRQDALSMSIAERRNAANYVHKEGLQAGDTLSFTAFDKRMYGREPHRWLMYTFRLQQGDSILPIVGLEIISKRKPTSRRVFFKDIQPRYRNGTGDIYMLKRQLFKVRFQEIRLLLPDKTFVVYVRFVEGRSTEAFEE